MIRLLMLAAALLIVPTGAWANDKADVRAAVDRWLAALNANDADGMAANQLPHGMTFRQFHAPDGTLKLSHRAMAEWVERARVSTDRVHERYWKPTILVHGGIAVLWAPYSFDLNGKRSHCGIDVFDLVKLEGKWLMANAMWTVEPNGCRK